MNPEVAAKYRSSVSAPAGRNLRRTVRDFLGRPRVQAYADWLNGK
jgi:hypothetical protein